MDKELLSLAILEKDKSNDSLNVWSYPSIERELETVIFERSGLKEKEATPLQFIWSKYGSEWIHIYTETNNPDTEIPRVTTFAIVLVTKIFHPEKFEALCNLFAKIYSATGSPVPVLECYLSVFTKNKVNTEKFGNFDIEEYDVRRSYLTTSIKDLIKPFGLPIILLWNALVMKKRVVVYCESLDLLLKMIRAIPLFIWHRQGWDILRPYVNLSEIQLAEMQRAGVYVAGFTDPAIKLKQDLYDVLIDISAKSITCAEHAMNDFKMGAFHKELATYMVTSANDPETPSQTLLKGIAVKTRDLVARLQQLMVEDSDGNKFVTLENLQQRQLPPNMDAFLFAVASAEGLTKVTSKQ